MFSGVVTTVEGVVSVVAIESDVVVESVVVVDSSLALLQENKKRKSIADRHMQRNLWGFIVFVFKIKKSEGQGWNARGKE